MMNPAEELKDLDAQIYRVGLTITFCAPVINTTVCRLIRLIQECIDEIQSEVAHVNKEVLTKLVTIEAKPIIINITTYGGSVSSAWMVVDTILNSPVPIHTVICGFVASAGTVISISGKKRFMHKHAYTLIHELRSSAWGKYSEMRDHMSNNEKVMNTLIKFYVEKTKMNEDELRNILTRDKYWDAEESLQSGLIDEIL